MGSRIIRFDSYGESPHKTAENIERHTKTRAASRIRVVGDDGNIKYVLTGCGSLPITECIEASLISLDTTVLLSYEWVKRFLSRDLG